MKRAALAIAFIVAFLAVTGTFIEMTGANGFVPPLPLTPDKNEPSLTVKSPENNKTYNANTIAYHLQVEKPSSWFTEFPVHGTIMTVSYTLDENKDVQIADEPEYYKQGPFEYKGILSNLSEGKHSLQVYVRSCSFYNSDKSTMGKEDDYYLDTYSEWINFTVDTLPPTVSILSLDSKTYDSTKIPLNFAISEPTSRLAYCLDNTNNVTITGNTTLTETPVGAHTLTVYSWDTAGNVGVSKTVNFTIAEETTPQPPEPLPIIFLPIASVFVVAVLCAGLLVYFKKRKHPTKEVL